jgi:hypothetical protein
MGTAQITYNWTRPGLGIDGAAVLRIDRSLWRWDVIYEATDRPTQGLFNLYKIETGDFEDTFGCDWIATDDRSAVRAACNTSGALWSLDAALQLVALTHPRVTQLADRTLLRRSASCYSSPPLDEICLDHEGHILYMATGSDEGNISVIEANFISPVIEPFRWLPDAEAHRTSTTLDDVQSALDLEFPGDWHLSNGQ